MSMPIGSSNPLSGFAPICIPMSYFSHASFGRSSRAFELHGCDSGNQHREPVKFTKHMKANCPPEVSEKAEHIPVDATGLLDKSGQQRLDVGAGCRRAIFDYRYSFLKNSILVSRFPRLFAWGTRLNSPHAKLRYSPKQRHGETGCCFPSGCAGADPARTLRGPHKMRGM